MKNNKQVHIVGFAPSSRDKAGYNNPEVDVWVLNEYFSILPEHGANNINRWFEIHQRDTVLNSSRATDYMDKLKASKIPIMMVQKFDDIPMSEAYPLDAIIKELDTDYFTNSISYMVAYAIYLGYEEIHLYGVDMAQDEEYCVSPETMVLMKDLTYKKAGEVKTGDEVVAFDEHPQGASKDRDFRVASVESAKQIIRPCYKLTFEDGTEVVCSQEHRWLAGGSQNQWVQTKNLVAKGTRKDGSCSHIVKPLDKWKPIYTYETGYLAAAIDGEGHFSQTKHSSNEGYNSNLGFAQRNNAMLHDFLKFADMYDYKFTGKEVEEGECRKLGMYKRKNILKFLGEVRPKRILENMDINSLGRMVGDKVALVKKEFVGEQPVIALGTTTGTFIAEGLASHNSKERPSVEYFVGYARAKGIKVYIPDESDICKVPYYYGFQEESASKINKAIAPKQKDLTTRITNDDLMVDEMIEHMDYYLKKYHFDIKPTVELIKSDNLKAVELEKKLHDGTLNLEERQTIVNEINVLKNKHIPLYEMEQVITKTWESLQKLKGHKKSRLFLAGARDVSEHLLKILCPYHSSEV